MKIVLADPSDEARGFVLRCLSLAGHEVFTATTGGQAWATVQQNAPDVLITELRFRDTGGEELMEKTRRLYPATLIVCATLDNSVRAAVDVYRAGADNYIAKPLAIDELLAIINRREAVKRQEAVVVCGQLRLDSFSKQLWVGDTSVYADGIDLAIVSILIRNQRNVVTHDSLVRSVWGMATLTDPTEPDVRINKLNKRLKAAGCLTMIYPVRELGGYMMSDIPPKTTEPTRKKRGAK